MTSKIAVSLPAIMLKSKSTFRAREKAANEQTDIDHFIYKLPQSSQVTILFRFLHYYICD